MYKRDVSSGSQHPFPQPDHGRAPSFAASAHATAASRPPVPWWRSRTWLRYLQDLLLVRGRRRYSLSIAEHHPLGATDTRRRQVLINPLKVGYPADLHARRQVRGAPTGEDTFRQAAAVALVEHEAGHIRHSGAKPEPTTLGWLWNALEDERQERLQAQAYPELGPLFDFLGDAIWLEAPPSSALLDACLLWRWEHDRPEAQRKFRPATAAEADRWHTRVRPLVEAAWTAESSERVAALAQQILGELGLIEDAPLPDSLPPTICACGSGEAGRRSGQEGHGNHVDGRPPSDPPAPPDGAIIPGRHAGGAGTGTRDPADHPPEADPGALLAAVEGAARDLARWLRPPIANVRTRPDASRGDLQLERALEGHTRPFDARRAPAPAPPRAWLLLVDVSGSMGDAERPDCPLYGAIRTAMWLDRAAELAGIAFGILAFNDGARPMRVRELAAGADALARRRIAGMTSSGGTRLAPAIAAAVARLASAPAAHQRLLLVLHDGDLNADDAVAVRLHLQRLVRQRDRPIHVMPLYLGSDAAVIAANERVFGHVLACPDLGAMTAQVRAWLRAAAA